MTQVKWTEIPAAQVPHNLTWQTLRCDAGQIVERSYGDFGRCVDDRSPYQRVRDRSDGSTTYYRRA